MQPADPNVRITRQMQRLNEITTLNAKTSPLLLLPAEIRNIIFALTLTHQGIFITSGSDNHIKKLINLLHVFCQIHSETALLPYALNRFTVFGWRNQVWPFLLQRTRAQILVMGEVRRIGDAPELDMSAKKWLEYGEQANLIDKKCARDRGMNLVGSEYVGRGAKE